MSEVEAEEERAVDEPLGVGTVLNDLLGDHPKTRMMVVFLSEQRRDLNATQLAELAGLDRSTVYRHLDDLIETGVVEKTRDVGNSPMYQLDADDPAAEKLAELEWELIDRVEE